MSFRRAWYTGIRPVLVILSLLAAPLPPNTIIRHRRVEGTKVIMHVLHESSSYKKIQPTKFILTIALSVLKTMDLK